MAHLEQHGGRQCAATAKRIAALAAEKLERIPSDEKSTRESLIRAGDRLRPVDARMAIAALRQALPLTDDRSPERVDILRRLGELTTDPSNSGKSEAGLAGASEISADSDGDPSAD